jgi:hypothetical protein
MSKTGSQSAQPRRQPYITCTVRCGTFFRLGKQVPISTEHSKNTAIGFSMLLISLPLLVPVAQDGVLPANTNSKSSDASLSNNFLIF